MKEVRNNGYANSWKRNDSRIPAKIQGPNLSTCRGATSYSAHSAFIINRNDLCLTMMPENATLKGA